MRRAAARRRTSPTPQDVPGAVRAPYPGFIEPCLATPGNRVPARGAWLHEIKHDGYRAQAHVRDANPTIYTRNGYDWTQRFKQIADALEPLYGHDLVLDGEIVVMDERGVADFHLLQDELSRNAPRRLTYLAFDLLYLDGYDLRSASLEDRKRVLRQLLDEVATNGRIQFNPHIEAEASAVFEQACALHLEGIVSKEIHSTYRSGRQDDWIKIKCAKTDTFPIIAFVEKLHASPRRIASLYLGRWEGDQLLYAGKAQTDFQQRMLYELRERLDPYIREDSPLAVPVKKPKATWVEPAVLAEIEYSAFTSGKRLRAPVFKGIRDDLMAPRKGPKRRQTPRSSSAPVPEYNILQLLPDAVVPAQEQLARYWRAVADMALPYITQRPLKLVRHERGVTFYHKGPLPSVPKTVHQLQIRKRDGGTGIRLWIDNLDGLLGLVEMGAVELHTWNSTVDDLERANVLVFDLDPGPGIAFDFVVQTALELRSLLRQEGWDSWPKLTGGKGLHVMVPLGTRTMSHNDALRYSRLLAEKLVNLRPGKITTSAALSARDGRLFIDYLRNGRGTTAVATFSPRARRGFPIAAPTSWRALEQGTRPDAFTLSRLPQIPLRHLTASTRREAASDETAVVASATRSTRRRRSSASRQNR